MSDNISSSNNELFNNFLNDFDLLIYPHCDLNSGIDFFSGQEEFNFNDSTVLTELTKYFNIKEEDLNIEELNTNIISDHEVNNFEVIPAVPSSNYESSQMNFSLKTELIEDGENNFVNHFNSLSTLPSKGIFENPKLDLKDFKTENFNSKENENVNNHLEKCPQNNCLKEFRNRTSLRKHLKTHGPRRYICKECGRSFKENSKLKRHHLIHSGEQPFSCEFCNKKFALSFNLKTHLRTHTGEKPFICNYMGCLRRFSQSTNLKYHLISHENIRSKNNRITRKRKSNFEKI